MKLPVEECPPFYQFYANYVEGEDILEELKAQLHSYVEFIRTIPEEKHLYRYAENKWTIKEVVGHNTDTERIKSTVALRIARNDKTPLPGFDEDAYPRESDFNLRTMEELLDEFIAVRKSSIALLSHLSEDELKRIGTASGKQISSRANFYFLYGHVAHHVKILKERYLV